MFGTAEIKSEVLNMDVQMYDEMETDGELLPAGAVPWMVGTAPDWPPNIVSGWIDAAMARGPLAPASNPLPLPPRTTTTAALAYTHHYHDHHHNLQHYHQQEPQQPQHKAYDGPRHAHPGDHPTHPTVPGTAGTAGEGSGTTGGGSGASAHDELWSLYMGYSHGPGSGHHDGPGNGHVAVQPAEGEPHGMTAAGHAAWAVASIGGAEQASGNGGGAAATADGWAAPGDRSDAGGGSDAVAAAAAAEVHCEGQVDDDAMVVAAEAAVADEVLDGEAVALMRAQLLHHPRTPELVHAVTACRKVGVRSRHVADALDAARHTAVEHLAQLRKEAGRLGRIAPPHDPQLDEFMDRYISLCNSYQVDLVAMFEEAEVIIRDFETKLCSALQGGGGGGGGGADARAHISATGGRHGSQGAAAPSGGGGGGGSCSSLGSGQPDTPSAKLELTTVLKRKYQAEILQLQEAFSRPKKAAKLPNESTATLKDWWNANFVWPYPSDDDKRLLCVAAELSATQINNWFINQRKRHWHKLFKGRQQPQSREESEQLMREMGLID